MDKSLGIFLIIVFGISGVGAAALAWLMPSLHLDKIEASLAGLIGIGFLVFQSVLFRHSGDSAGESLSTEVRAEDRN